MLCINISVNAVAHSMLVKHADIWEFPTSYPGPFFHVEIETLVKPDEGREGPGKIGSRDSKILQNFWSIWSHDVLKPILYGRELFGHITY